MEYTNIKKIPSTPYLLVNIMPGANRDITDAHNQKQ
jgi:hypothetical protein